MNSFTLDNQSNKKSVELVSEASGVLTFEEFGLKESLMRGVKESGFKIPSPIQQKVIPLILTGKDVVAQAHTGTGKTAAFGLPAMNLLEKENGIGILVITPTRELATQVSDELYRLGNFAGMKTVTIYGGQSIFRQAEMIRKGPQIVVATPGRLLDMLSSNKLGNFKPSIVVLDEADEMLDMGFLEDIQKIFTYLPKKRQTLLFSATMPAPIQKLAKEILIEPVFVSVTSSETTNKNIKQYYYVIEEHERDDAVIRLMDSQDASKSIIFCRTKKEVDRLGTTLSAHGYSAKGLHGDMEQSQREEVIYGFRNGKIDILVATDVAARGLNVTDVSHVFNYHIPFDPESYVHRIGRTARAGKKGVAITLVTPREFRGLQHISKTVGTQIEHSFIPTLKEAKKVQLAKLLNEIKRQPFSEEASMTLKAIEEEMDLPQIAYKLISLLLEQQNISGPERIGVDSKRIESLLRPMYDRGRGGSGSRNMYRQGNGGGRGYRGKPAFSDKKPRSFAQKP